jgi:ABC-2 type transport system ATP-binding protein
VLEGDDEKERYMLELRDVSKISDGSPVVDETSFSARAGEVTGYLGRNGSG